MNEVTVRLASSITEKWPAINPEDLVNTIEEILYDYEIQPKSTALVPINNMMDKIRLYLGTRQLDGVAKGTLYNYKLFLVKFAAYLRKNVEDITTMDIRRFLADYATTTGIMKSTMGTKVAMIKSFFAWLVDQDYIVKDPTRAIRATKQEKHMRKSLSEEELERLRVACQTPLERAILEMYYATGCRLSELTAVTIGQIDWGEMSMRVIGKGSKERMVYFNSKARLYLQKYLAWRGSRRDDDPLFMTIRRPHHAIGGKRIQEILHEIADRAGFSRSIHPHLLRHTNATLALKHGASLTTIQTLLGHASPATTVIYAQADMDTVRHEYRRSVAQ